MRTCLRRETRIHLDHRARRFFRFRHDHLSKQTKSTIQYYPVQGRLRPHVAARPLDAPSSTTGHTPNVELLQGKYIGRIDDLPRDLMGIIPPRVGFAFASPRQPLCRRDPFASLPVGHAAAAISLGYRFQFALQAGRRGFAFFANSGISDQPPIGERRQYPYATIGSTAA